MDTHIQKRKRNLAPKKSNQEEEVQGNRYTHNKEELLQKARCEIDTQVDIENKANEA